VIDEIGDGRMKDVRCGDEMSGGIWWMVMMMSMRCLSYDDWNDENDELFVSNYSGISSSRQALPNSRTF